MDRKQARSVLSAAEELLAQATRIESAVASAEQALVAASERVVDRDVRDQLEAMPLESLRGAVSARVAWSALLDAGYRTVGDIDAASARQLLAIDGVGEQSSIVVKTAASDIARSVRESCRPALRHERAEGEDLQLVTAVVNLDAVVTATRQAAGAASAFSRSAPRALVDATPLRSRVRWFLSRGARRQAAERAIAELDSLVQQHAAPIRDATARLPSAITGDLAVSAYVSDAARFQSVLDSRIGPRRTSTGLPDDLVEAIEAFPLDVSGLRVMLRRYQEFGAKFILQQGRVLLGDDMGLGKTVQALAAMAHLAAEVPGFRALVVAPASVLVNWEREIVAKSDLTHATPQEWESTGGVVVTTFERLRNLPVATLSRIDLLVVDEAHYIKNPDAQRTQRVRDLLERCDRVLFMTGTAIENRGAEFVELVRLLDPAVASRLVGPESLLAPQVFRDRVAPLYLRRNSDEVLTELPELIEIDEWEEMTGHDFEHYRHAVATGNLMAMRRAGFMAGAMRRSAKLDRLLELVSEARSSGHKVIIYSYFLDVLDIVMVALSGPTFGPITGAMSSKQRQAVIDEFTAAESGSVLVAQIVAGGVGLNIQAASVVILCEPQFKPSTENQAVARARRMGQLKAVQVHRLLNPDSVDERVLEILDGKILEFANYARVSALADASDTAIDDRVALRLVVDERKRLGLSE